MLWLLEGIFSFFFKTIWMVVWAIFATLRKLGKGEAAKEPPPQPQPRHSPQPRQTLQSHEPPRAPSTEAYTTPPPSPPPQTININITMPQAQPAPVTYATSGAQQPHNVSVLSQPDNLIYCTMSREVTVLHPYGAELDELVHYMAFVRMREAFNAVQPQEVTELQMPSLPEPEPLPKLTIPKPDGRLWLATTREIRLA